MWDIWEICSINFIKWNRFLFRCLCKYSYLKRQFCGVLLEVNAQKGEEYLAIQAGQMTKGQTRTFMHSSRASKARDEKKLLAENSAKRPVLPRTFLMRFARFTQGCNLLRWSHYAASGKFIRVKPATRHKWIPDITKLGRTGHSTYALTLK